MTRNKSEKTKAILKRLSTNRNFAEVAREFGTSRQYVHFVYTNYYKHTNADRIRMMSDEELSLFINFHTNCEDCPASKDCQCAYTIDSNKCVATILEWLKKEVEDVSIN